MVIHSVSQDSALDSGQLLADVRRVFASGRTLSLRWRLDQLRGIERLVEERESEIAAALAEDLGRSAMEAWLGDIASTKAEAAYARRHVKNWMRRRRASLPLSQLPGRAWVQYDPLGVALIIGPWNYPLYLSLAPLVAGVAAGNCAVIKPSELAPATSALLAELLPRYVDPEAVRVVEGDAATTQDLLAQGFDHALFTGGTEVGKKITAAAAPTLTPVTLELGGKSPVIVAADADVDVAARRIAWVKLLNSGQICIAPDYVLADQAIADELADKIVANIQEFRSAESLRSLRIVNQRQFDRLVSLISATDGKVVAGGGSDRSTLRIDPTVIVNPSPDDPVMSEEIFGPILPIVTVESGLCSGIRQCATEAVGPVRVHSVVVTCPRLDRPHSVRRRGDQPRRDALPGAVAAVRWCGCERDGGIPRPVGLRNAQSPPGGSVQARQTRSPAGLSAVYRPGIEADAEVVLMKVVVDRNKCSGIGLCEVTAPAVFEVGDDGQSRVINEQPSAAEMPTVEEAIGSCPTGALSVVDESTE